MPYGVVTGPDGYVASRNTTDEAFGFEYRILRIDLAALGSDLSKVNTAHEPRSLVPPLLMMRASLPEVDPIESLVEEEPSNSRVPPLLIVVPKPGGSGVRVRARLTACQPTPTR